MTIGRSGYVLIAVLVALPTVSAAEKYTLKIETPARVGDRSKHVVSDNTETNMTVRDSDGKTVQESKERVEMTAVYEETILVKKDGERAAKRSRKYESITATKDGAKLDLDLVGKVVVIERKGKEHSFTYEGGGKVTGESLAFLMQEFKNKGEQEHTMERSLMPKAPVSVGESWKCDIEEIAKSLGHDENGAVDKDKSKATAKLLKVYSKEGATFGVIEVTIDLAMTRLGKASDPITADASSTLGFKVTLDACIDGSRTSFVMSAGMKADMGGKVKSPTGEFTLKVTGTGKMSHTHVPAK